MQLDRFRIFASEIRSDVIINQQLDATSVYRFYESQWYDSDDNTIEDENLITYLGSVGKALFLSMDDNISSGERIHHVSTSAHG